MPTEPATAAFRPATRPVRLSHVKHGKLHDLAGVVGVIGSAPWVRKNEGVIAASNKKVIRVWFGVSWSCAVSFSYVT
jgi:hypothetical protein